MKRIAVLLVLLAAGPVARADEPKKLLNVPYGKHPRQVLDFYQAKSDKPTPVVFYIHGGGWQGGDKKNSIRKPFLDKGISVVAINYRYVKNGVEEKVEPPVKAPLEDAARALQFVRSKADGMEHRQEAHRRHRRLGRRLLVALARLPRRHGRPQEQRPDRPRIDPAVLRGRRRGAGLARPEGTARVDAELQLRRPRLRPAELREL